MYNFEKIANIKKDFIEQANLEKEGIKTNQHLNEPLGLRLRDNKRLNELAPNDFVQVERASNLMLEINGCHYDVWKKNSTAERLNTLKKIEKGISEIAHRPECEIKLKSLGSGHYGYYDPVKKTITINSNYLKDDFESYKSCLDTIIHEGRHAYQDYNLTCKEVHSSPGDITNWRLNENKYGYQSAERFGFKLYWMQPVEADARKFAEDVIKKFESKV